MGKHTSLFQILDTDEEEVYSIDDKLCCKSFAGDKHVSLLRKFVNYGQKKFYKIGPRRQLYETGVNLPTLCCKLDQLHNGTERFEKCKQLLEYQNLLFLSDIWWLKL